MSFSDYAAKIKAIILDVDGVLTDGRMGYDGHTVTKYFDVRDGHAIKMALREGLLVGILSGRDDLATRTRAEELGLSFIHVGQKIKITAFEQILTDHDLTPDQCIYVGDDVVDIPVMRRVGLPLCPADADPIVATYATWQTTAPGGRGAVRELIFRLMQEQGTFDRAMARYIG